VLVTVWLLLGLSLGGGFIAFERALVSKERPFFVAGLFTVALIYVGFAAVGDGADWLKVEAAGVALYGGMGLLGMFHSSRWLVAGWTAHPIWDIGLHFFGGGSAFTPAAYSISCVSFDLLVAIYLVTQLKKWDETA
jgi:hypothetical protein